MEKNDNKFLFTRKDIAIIFGVDEKAVHKWVNNNGCPVKIVGRSKKYDVREVVQWRNQKTGNFDDEGADISSLSILEQINVYKRDALKSEAELKDIKAKIMKGEYLARDEVLSNITNSLAVFKKSLLNLANKVVSMVSIYAPQEEHREIAENVENICKDCLNNLSTGEEYAPK